MTWLLIYTPNGKDPFNHIVLPQDIKGEWSDEQVQQAVAEIIESGRDSLILRGVVSRFLPKPISDVV